MFNVLHSNSECLSVLSLLSSDPKSLLVRGFGVFSTGLTYFQTDVHGVNVISTPGGLLSDEIQNIGPCSIK